jgi:CDP-diacylglycerol---glycerol-3-phosphate 3-phosphatidyltransferase
MSYSNLTLAKALLNVMCEVDSLHGALHNKPKLRIHMLLDYNRSTRPGSESTARILLPILKEFPNRVRISLFRSPKLKGLMAKLVPPRFNEGWGTWHPKIYGIDSEVMLSG